MCSVWRTDDDLPISSEFDFGESTVVFFVDFDILGTARTAVTVLVRDLDLFLFLTTSAGQRGGEGSSASFVTFPSDALGVDLSFYSSASSLFDDVAPVRRGEDAERHRDSGVKVQVDCGTGKRMWCLGQPSKCSDNNSKGGKDDDALDAW